jgi:hypothetical protein
MSVNSFYYADERTAEGGPVAMALSREAAAEFYFGLAQSTKQLLWLATFVKGIGYVKF